MTQHPGYGVSRATDGALPSLPEQRFSCIAIDPPWEFRTRGRSVDGRADRGPERHYPTMTLGAIKALPVPAMLTTDANVYLWITGPLLARGVHTALFDAWGLEAASLWLVWIKLWNEFDRQKLFTTALLERDIAMGTGFTTRQNAEFVVLGRRGAGVPRGNASVRQVLVSNRREHSRKPDEFYRRVEAYQPDCARLDMFGGRPRPGWDYWGFPHWETPR